jgi:phosphoglycolate phosphatase-like HAD superfamily hydrolase
MDKHLVAFDINGTLLADRKQFFEALNAIFIHFDSNPLPPDEIQERFSQPWTDLYREAGISTLNTARRSCTASTTTPTGLLPLLRKRPTDAHRY